MVLVTPRLLLQEAGRERERERERATYLITMQPPSGMLLIGTSTDASAKTSADAFM
jgi:hypothetical protein